MFCFTPSLAFFGNFWEILDFFSSLFDFSLSSQKETN